MSNIKERLSKMQDAFRVTRSQYDQRFGGVKIEPGEYKGKLQRCSLDERKSDGALVMAVEYVIMDGQYKGFTTFDQMNLDNEWGRLFAQRFIEISGYQFPEPEEIETLPAVVQAVAKDAGIYLIEAKKNGDYINIIPKMLLTEEQPPEEVAPTPKKNTTVSPAKVEKTNTPAQKPVEVDNSESEITVELLSTMDRKMLKQVITEKDIDFRVTTKHSDDDIRQAIISGLGLTVEEVSETASEEKIPTDDELKTDLMVFCKSHRIKGVVKTMSLDDMLNLLDEYTFPKDELEEDEIKLLTMLAMDKCIEA